MINFEKCKNSVKGNNERGITMIVTEKFRGQEVIARRGVCNEVIVNQSLVTPIIEHHTFRVNPVTFRMEDKGIIVSPATNGTFILADKLGISEETVLAGATVVSRDGLLGVLVEVVSGGVYFQEGNDVYYLSSEGVCSFAPEVAFAKSSLNDRNERVLSKDEHMLWLSGQRLLNSIACCFNNKYRVAEYDKTIRNIGEGLDNVVFEIIMGYYKDKLGLGWTLSYNLLNSYVDLARGKMKFAYSIKQVKKPVLNYSRSTGDFEDYEDLFSPIVNPEYTVDVDESEAYNAID